MSVKIFIADDHYMIMEGIRSLLQHEENFEWIGEAMDADACLAAFEKRLPDILFLDINLPGKSGIDLCKEVKEKYPSVHVIGLSSFNQLSFIQKMMQNHASGYVLKNATREELIEAIETVMQGSLYMSPEAAATMQQVEASKIPIITKREKEVLNLIAEGLTNHEIADKLFISQTTVDTHRKNLLTKFEVKNTAILIKMAAQFQFI